MPFLSATPRDTADRPLGGRRPRTRRRAAGAVAGLVLLGLLGACGGAVQDSGTAGDVAPHSADADGGGGGGGRENQDESAPTGGDAGASSDTAVDQPRKIRRGGVSVRVDDLTGAASWVRAEAETLGGYVSDESIGLAVDGYVADAGYEPSDGSGSSSGELVPFYGPGEGRIVARVPSDRMTEAVDAFAAVGTELSRWSSEREVETALVDLESRVATQTASVERVRALLDGATSLSDVVTLESELSRREADLESLKAQLESLSGRAALATVTVVLRTPDRAAEVDDQPGLLGGLGAGWDALGASTVVLLTVLGALLPFAVVAAVIGVPLVLWRRRVRRARPAGTADRPAPAQPVDTPAGGDATS